MSARRTASALCLDFSDGSLTRWEFRFGASLQVAVRAWYSSQEQGLVSEPITPARCMRYSWHVIKGDATNALVWNKTKLHTCEVLPAYLTSGIEMSSGMHQHHHTIIIILHLQRHDPIIILHLQHHDRHHHHG